MINDLEGVFAVFDLEELLVGGVEILQVDCLVERGVGVLEKVLLHVHLV